jgi:hypothetical protein
MALLGLRHSPYLAGATASPQDVELAIIDPRGAEFAGVIHP